MEHQVLSQKTSRNKQRLRWETERSFFYDVTCNRASVFTAICKTAERRRQVKVAEDQTDSSHKSFKNVEKSS